MANMLTTATDLSTLSTLSTLSPVEIDTILAANAMEQSRINSYLNGARDSVRRSAGFERDRRTNRWTSTLAKAMAICEAKSTVTIENGRGETVTYRSQAGEVLDYLAKYEAKLAELIVVAAPHNAEYARRPWARYFLVTNSNGHVHSSMNCNTCFWTTRYSWLVELADKTQDEMVEQFGEMACTVCFKDAPTNPAFHTPGSRSRAAVAEKAAEKAAKQAAKDVKNLLTPVKLGYSTVKTIVAARNELKGNLRNLAYYGATHPSAAQWVSETHDLAAALRARDIDVDALLPKWEKDIRKETGSWFAIQSL